MLFAPEPEVRARELPPLSISRPSPKRQRAGAVQDLADIPLLHYSGSALDGGSDTRRILDIPGPMVIDHLH